MKWKTADAYRKNLIFVPRRQIFLIIESALKIDKFLTCNWILSLHFSCLSHSEVTKIHFLSAIISFLFFKCLKLSKKNRFTRKLKCFLSLVKFFVAEFPWVQFKRETLNSFNFTVIITTNRSRAVSKNTHGLQQSAAVSN